jgi:hypothetical protein
VGDAVNPWEAVEAARPMAYQVGGYTIAALAYTMFPGTNRERHVTGKIWIENAEGEGMEADPEDIPEGVTEEWLDEFWKENF